MAFNQVINLLDATKEDQQRFMDSFDLILTDCDGTVWNVYSPIEGAGTGVKALRDNGKRIVYSSNNATRSAEAYEAKFIESGIKATFEDVMHPGVAAIDYLKQINFDGLIYMIGTQNLKNLIEKAGYEVFHGPNDLVGEDFASLIGAVFDDRPVRAVIIDADFNLSLKQLMKAHIYLLNADCEFVVCATDMVLPYKVPIIGPGHFYKIVEQMTGRTGIVVGKPGAQLKEIVMKKYDVTDPRRVLFIGDSLESDIGFGKVCDFQTLAVLTGSTTKSAIAGHANKEEVPDYVLPSFADFAVICKNLSGSAKL